MNKKSESPSLKEKIMTFWKSEDQIPSAIREVASVLVTVGVIVLALYLICGTWPAIVTIESESMVPHMNVGDLVIVIAPDRLGALQSMSDGNTTGYTKFGMPGDVIIYKPNGNDKLHPIIHRALTWVNEGDEMMIRNGTHVVAGQAPHAGYITKGDNNPVNDQIGWSDYRGIGTLEPVKKEWIIGKAYASIPYIGYLPLNIYPVIAIVVVLMVLHELYLRSKARKEVPKKKR